MTESNIVLQTLSRMILENLKGCELIRNIHFALRDFCYTLMPLSVMHN
jgi:hypothetical protein